MGFLVSKNFVINQRHLMFFLLLVLLVFFVVPDALAAGTEAGNSGTTDHFTDACKKVTGFFARFETILRVASISIVTIAVVFAGYQIAFAHKRLSDVAPVLIGGLLIGGAATIAGWFVGDLQDGRVGGDNYVADCGT